MGFSKRDLYNNVQAAEAFGAAVSSDTTTSGPAVDMRGFRSAMFVLHAVLYTDGTYTPNLQDSDDGSTWADVAGTYLAGSEAAVDADGAVSKVGYVGKKRYARLQVVSTSTSSGATLSGIALLGDADSGPVS